MDKFAKFAKHVMAIVVAFVLGDLIGHGAQEQYNRDVLDIDDESLTFWGRQEARLSLLFSYLIGTFVRDGLIVKKAKDTDNDET